MSHERSETVQDPDTKKFVNVYGRGTERAGARLPPDSTGFGHGDYDTVDEAVDQAKKRSAAQRETRTPMPPAVPEGYADGGPVDKHLSEPAKLLFRNKCRGRG